MQKKQTKVILRMVENASEKCNRAKSDYHRKHHAIEWIFLQKIHFHFAENRMISGA